MDTIRIVEFPDYTSSLFEEYLDLLPPGFLNIVIPKEFGSDEKDLLLSDYYRALYIAQQLACIGGDVLHSIPEAYEKGEFAFIIPHANTCKLAPFLARVCKSYDVNGHCEEYMQFDNEALDWFCTITSEEELACPYFLGDIIDLEG